MAEAVEGMSSSPVSVQCAICLDQLHTPKALPCLHTFCLTCLRRHITATVRAKGNKFACPECRSKCSPPNPKRPVEEWANQFPTNFHLQNLIEAFQQKPSLGNKGQETVRDIFAQRLKESRAFMDNILLDLGAEQQSISAKRSHVTNTWNKSKDELHEVFADIISAVEVRKEELMQKLDEEYVENTQFLFDKEDHISTRMKQLHHCSEDITKLMTGEEDPSFKLAGIEQKLDQTRQDMSVEVLVREKPNSALVINPDDVATILSGIATLGTFKADLPADGTDHESPLPSPASASVSSSLYSYKSTNLNDQRLTASAEQRCKAELLPKESPSESQVKPEYVSCYSLVSPGDKKEPFVTGVCFLAGLLLLTDVNNSCLKILYLPPGNHGHVRRESLSLRSDPLCVTSLGAGHAVVGSEHCIYVLKVHDGIKLTIQDTVETSKCYYGITALPDEHSVAACSDQPPCVDVVNLHTRNITHTISKNSANDTALFTSPFYLTTLSQGRLLVSDKDNTLPLTCITTTGDVLYRYVSSAPNEASSTKLMWPLGVCGCRQGTALVVDAAQHAVYQLSADGCMASKVLHDEGRLRSPSALCFNDTTDSLYVVSNKGRMLLVYRLAPNSQTYSI